MLVFGEIDVGVPVDSVFAALADPSYVAEHIPGLHDLRRIGDSSHTAVLDLNVGPLTRRLEIQIDHVHLNPPTEIAVELRGAPLGALLGLNGRWEFRLKDLGERTSIQYAIETNLTGTLGSVGERVLQARADEIKNQIMNGLRALG